MLKSIVCKFLLYYLSVILLFLSAGFYAPAVAAEEGEYLPRVHDKLAEGGLIWPPYIIGGLGIEVFSDHTFRADDPDDEVSDTFTETDLSFLVLFSGEFYLETNFKLFPVNEPDPGEDRFFEDHGIGLTTLSLTYENELFWLSAGKGRANFGIASSAAAGIWGADISADFYDVTDRVGLSGTVNLDTEKAGHHSFYLATFFLDTSDLSRTWITKTGPNRKEDGGPSNTESLKSFALTVDGSGIPSLPKFRYHLAGLMQSTDRLNDENGNRLPDSQVADEYRIAAAGEWSSISLCDSVTMTPLVEYVRFWNARGFRDDTEDYLTASLDFYIGQWNAALAATGVRIEDDDGDVDKNLQAQVSFGYLFTTGIQLDAGYRYLDAAGEASHTFGLSFGYFLPFAF